MRYNWIPLLALACTAIPLQAGATGSPATFAPPDLAGFTLHRENDADGDGDKVNETHVRHYLNDNGDSLVSMSIKGVVWAWSLETRDDESGLRNYVIRDSDCDGVFDEVYSLDDKFYIPDCMK